MTSLYMVHVPKTGGRYVVVRALNHELVEWKRLPRGALYRGHPQGRLYYGGHNVCHTEPDSPIQYFTECCAADPEFQRSLTFSIVRNPFDLLVSMFTGGWPYQPRIHPHRFEEFDAFLEAYCDPDFSWAVPLQKRFLFFQLVDDSGACAVDRLLRFEALDDELATLCAPLGVVPVKGDPFRPSRHGEARDYRRWYTDRLRELVETKCALELEQLGYTFDGPTGALDPKAVHFDL